MATKEKTTLIKNVTIFDDYFLTLFRKNQFYELFVQWRQFFIRMFVHINIKKA